MNDRSSEQTNYSELRFAGKSSFFNDNSKLRWFIILIFAAALFCILHFRETAFEMLEVSTIAPGYVVSQIDFEFYDDEATIILKQEAVRDVGKIYNIDSKQIRQRQGEYDTDLIYQQSWRKNPDGSLDEASTFQELHRGAELLEKTLAQMRFTDPRTLQKLREVNLSTDDYQIYTPISITDEVALPPHIWALLQQQILGSDSSAETTDFIIGWFADKSWKLLEDIPAQTLLSKKLKNRVPDKYTSVAAGSRIIDQGDKVTPRHVAMMQAMQRAMQEKRNLWHPLTLLGSAILALLLTAICSVYFYVNHPKVASSNRSLLLLITIIIMTFAFAKGTEFMLLTSFNSLIDAVRYPVFVPFAAILLCCLMNPAVATFVSGILTIVLTMSLAFDRQGFMIVNLVASFVAILATRSLQQRTEIFAVCFKSWLACVATFFGLSLYQNAFGNIHLATDIAIAAINLLVIAVLVVGVLPLLESGFKVMTDASLTEYMDPNHSLLRRLSMEAPGTYQHSIVVGNLAEAAALSIGANGLFCRVATLYHDIGKMIGPQYFTENQMGNSNPHLQLTPKESSEIILSHVSEGEAMARKAGLPEQFIDIIREHHGTTLVYYFYRKEFERLGEHAAEIDENAFRYAGPKPRSKESAIIMIADTVEAASRSLDVINEDNLMQLATRLIKEKADDGQFDNCLLTFEELSTVKSSLVKTLVAYSHSRIKYPSREAPKQISTTPEEMYET